MNSEDIANWLAAVSTLLAVVVALFREDIVGWWRRPHLVLELRGEPPDSQRIPAIRTSKTPQGTTVEILMAYYLRIWIMNDGNVSAENVQVFVSALRRKQANGEYKKITNFLPMNLRWSHTSNENGSGKIFAERISPKMGRYCDLAHIMQSERNIPIVAELDVEVVPNTESHKLKAGVYEIDLSIAASNAKPTKKTIEMNFMGKWFHDEMEMLREGVGLRIVS